MAIILGWFTLITFFMEPPIDELLPASYSDITHSEWEIKMMGYGFASLASGIFGAVIGAVEMVYARRKLVDTEKETD